MSAGRLVQLVATASPADAVTDFALELDGWARERGWVTDRVADRIHPALRGTFAAVAAAPLAGDLLLYHHSLGAGLVERVAGFAGRAVVLSHSVTPARFFRAVSPVHERAARRGREELSALAGLTPAPEAVGVSPYDADELRDAGFAAVRVAPIAPAVGRLAAAPRASTLERLERERAGGPLVLHVGRLAPNKRIEDLLATHAAVRRRAPGAHLVLVGSDAGQEGYAGFVREYARRLGADGVVFAGPVDDADLAAHYRAATVYLSASEHEGRGLPLIEAMHHGVPVVARAAAAVPDTLGGAGVLLRGRDPERWARVVLAVAGHAGLREGLIEAGRRRAAALRAGSLPVGLDDLLAGRPPGEGDGDGDHDRGRAMTAPRRWGRP